jgi:hypothetical protein
LLQTSDAPLLQTSEPQDARLQQIQKNSKAANENEPTIKEECYKLNGP